MSYLTNVGADVDTSIENSDKDFSKALKSFKSGTSYKVRLLGILDRAEYFSHSAYKVFYTTIHTPEDLYCKARAILFQDANAIEDEEAKKPILEMAKALKPQPRYLFGFASIAGETAGEQIVLDLTKAQAKIVIAAINKNANKIGKKAFELEKTGASTNTVVSFSALDLEDLNEKELAAFEGFEGQEFDKEVFGNIFRPNTEAQQLQDLTKLGFDVKRLNGDSSQSASEEGKKEEYDF
ncbi:MAG: hypothetical protein ACQEUT_18435 [Bacillota bacterium]